MPDAIDGAELRRRWDSACDTADSRLRTARDAATGDAQWLARWLTGCIDQLAVIRSQVDGKRRIPGSVASGLLRDVPPDVQEEPYASAVAALEEVDRLFVSGLDATGWDWSNGYPPGWPVSLKDRLRSFVPVHKA